MELFKIHGKFAVETADGIKDLDNASEAAKETGESVQKAADEADKGSSKFGAAFKKIGNAAVAIGKTVAVGMAAAGAAVAGVVTKSIQSYADYEQLVGGVETLFGAGGKSLEEYAESVGKTVNEVRGEYNRLMNAQGNVLQDAKEAYKTAGLSANEYMETVTSFSAALIKSLNGDTEAAATKANTAIVDMADNANKMGSSMESIQNAYQGFAKQNYTMLDNLKLGYGGTKEEMARLLKDAEKLSGQKFNLESYADIVDAIHIIQTEMGITGTTAKEASSTISGSLASMKASWQNLLTAVADDKLPFDDYVNAFVESATTVADNLMPRIQIALNGVAKLIGNLAPVIAQKLPEMLREVLPSLISGAAALLRELAIVLPDLAMVLVEQLPFIVSSIKSALLGLFPQLQEPFSVIEKMFSGVWQALKLVWEQVGIPIFNAMSNIFNSASQAISPLIDAFKAYVLEGEFAEDVTAAITTAIGFLKGAYEAVSGFITGVVDGFKAAVEWGKEHETAVALIAVAIGTLTAAIVAYNVAQAIKNAGGIAEIAQLAWIRIQLWASTAAHAAHTVATTVATAATTAFGAAMAFLTSPITLVVLAIGALIAIVVLCVKHWDKIKEAGAKAWEWIKEKWADAGAWFAGIWNSIKNVFANLGQWFSDKFRAAKEGVQNIWSGITNFFSKIYSKIKDVFGKVKDAILSPFKTAIDKVKSIFNSLKLKFPKIKLPHFSIKPSGWKIGDLLEGSIPKLGIEWYAKAMNNPMVMKSPTVFGYNSATGKLMGGGENGSEVVSGTNTLMGMIQNAVAVQVGGLAGILQSVLEILAEYFPQLLDAFDVSVYMDSGALVGEIASPMNKALAKISNKEGRGR